jgi:DNA-binding NarL/FixJ family response regulator
MEAVRIVIVTHNDLLRAQLRAHAESDEDIEVVAEARSGHQAIASAIEHAPDLAIVDDDLPGLSGQAVSAVMLRHVPGLQVISVVPVLDYDHLNDTVRFGGATAITPSSSAEEVVSAIRAVTTEAFRFHPWPAQRLATEYADGFCHEGTDIHLTLNSLQAEILDCLLVGMNAGEITRELEITNYALRREMAGLFDALHVEKKVGAIAAALERRWSNVGRRAPSITNATPAVDAPGPPAWLNSLGAVFAHRQVTEIAV